MKGQNTLVLNQATMMEALQVWVDRQFTIDQAPVVAGVTVDEYYGEEPLTYRVIVTEPDRG